MLGHSDLSNHNATAMGHGYADEAVQAQMQAKSAYAQAHLTNTAAQYPQQDVRPAGLLDSAIQEGMITGQSIATAASRLESVAERIFGPPPPQGANAQSAQGPGAPSHINALAGTIQTQRAQLERLFSVVERLESL